MSRARTMQLIALKQTIALQAYRREANRLFEEIARLDARIAQIAELDRGYREQLTVPGMHITEYRDVLQIIGRLRERSDIDKARNEILDVERTRLLNALILRRKNGVAGLSTPLDTSFCAIKEPTTAEFFIETFKKIKRFFTQDCPDTPTFA